MNTLLHCFELNLVLTVICKAFKMKDQLPLLAFYRALIYHRQRYVARDSSKSSHERCLEELHFVIQNRDRLALGGKTKWFEYVCQQMRQEQLDSMKQPVPAKV